MITLRTYYVLSSLLRPFLILLMHWRAKKGKEDPLRLGERKGIASIPRPNKPILWIHAVSVGETQAALKIIESLKQVHPTHQILLTTNTMGSYKLIQTLKDTTLLHQFIPFDSPPWVKRFLEYWKPEIALFMESELWPNLILETHTKGIPLLLLNGRISGTSFKRWQKNPQLISPLLQKFSMCLVHDDVQDVRFKSLGAGHVKIIGDLKLCSNPLSYEEAAYARLKSTRPSWLAASIHRSDLSVIIDTHKELLKTYPNLLLWLVPRHPERVPLMQGILHTSGLTTTCHTQGHPPSSTTQVYIVDEIGSMGLFYRLTDICFVGGSLQPGHHGGHNPLEPARLGSAVLFGPEMTNCRHTANQLLAAGAAIECPTANTLAGTITTLLKDSSLKATMIASALSFTKDQGETLSLALMEIEKHLGPTS